MYHCFYLKKYDTSYIILSLYVDNILIARVEMREINILKRHMSEVFNIKDLGTSSISNDRFEGTIKLS